VIYFSTRVIYFLASVTFTFPQRCVSIPVKCGFDIVYFGDLLRYFDIPPCDIHLKVLQLIGNYNVILAYMVHENS